MKYFQRLRSLTQRRTARDASWIMAGQAVNLLFQALHFILLARLLGVVAYGVFAGAFALVNMVTPYSALGSAMLFMRYVSVDRNRARAFWGNMLLTILGTSAFLGAALLLIAPRMLGANRQHLVLLLVISNCVMAQIVTCASSVFLTFARPKGAALNRFLANFLRTLMLLFMLLIVRSATAAQWALAYLTASAIAALVALVWVSRVIGSATYDVSHMRSHFAEGLGFSVAASTEAIYNDLDKVILSHNGMNEAVGIYTLAYRVVDFATTPVSSILSVVVPRWFALHDKSPGEVFFAASRILPACIAVAAGAGLSVFLGAPWIVRLVGRGFADSALAIRWLCLLPLLRAIHLTTGDVLTTTGLQTQRTGAQFVTGVLNVLLNLWLIPRYGWHGAAWASLGSDAFLGFTNILLVGLLRAPGKLIQE